MVWSRGVENWGISLVLKHGSESVLKLQGYFFVGRVENIGVVISIFAGGSIEMEVVNDVN